MLSGVVIVLLLSVVGELNAFLNMNSDNLIVLLVLSVTQYPHISPNVTYLYLSTWQ